MTLEKELDFACRVAGEAASVVLDHYSRDVAVRWKGRNDPVTDADEASTLCILERLSQAFPADAVLIEEREDDRSRLASSRTWIVDPLDGTKEFLSRNGEFSVMVGFVLEGRPVLGAVAVPAAGILYAGMEGGGAFVADPKGRRTPIARDAGVEPSRARLIVSRSHRSARIDAVKQRLGIEKEIACGSVGLKMIKVVSGEADLYVHFGRGAKLWDTCAPEAVARAAGIGFSDIRGRDIDYLSDQVMLERGIVVAPLSLHAEVVRALSDMDP
jgi:3'(2'), 5'-bisphosphate nucleotidase